MNVYQIAVPETANDGLASYHDAQDTFETMILVRAGGYTDLGVRVGAWKDPSDGKVYKERMRWYQVACEPGDWNVVIEYAFDLFPDQVAFFVAQVGTAEIIERPREVKPLPAAEIDAIATGVAAAWARQFPAAE